MRRKNDTSTRFPGIAGNPIGRKQRLPRQSVAAKSNEFGAAVSSGGDAATLGESNE